MSARLSAFVIWALIAATAVFWGLRFLVRPAAAPLHTVANSDVLVGRGDLTRLLGAPPVATAAAAPEAVSRFHLLGIVAPKHARPGFVGYGVALIAVDGKPARAYSVGSHLDSDLILQSVSLRTAAIGPAQGAKTVLLEIPPFAAPATGALPVAGLPAGPVPPLLPVQPLPAQPPPGVAPAAAAPPGPVSMQRDGGALTQ